MKAYYWSRSEERQEIQRATTGGKPVQYIAQYSAHLCVLSSLCSLRLRERKPTRLNTTIRTAQFNKSQAACLHCYNDRMISIQSCSPCVQPPKIK